jgi:CHAT domain-containing protein
MAYVGREATADILYREGSARRTLHLACHGTFNPQAPLASGLLLADGKLDAMAILQGSQLQAELVVLSACDTGQATVLRGDELMGLARAILYAGAAAVLVSLWPVDDLATALLMDAFYRERAELSPGPLGTAEALRRAQLALRSMSLDEALAGCERLTGTAASRDRESGGWADVSLAHLHAEAGDGRGARRLVERARSVLPAVDEAMLMARLTRWSTREEEAQDGKPYAHHYYWAPFALICRSVSSLPFPAQRGSERIKAGETRTAS